MTMKDITDPAVLKPGLTADGKVWYQKCFICLHQIDFIKRNTPWVNVGGLVRHKKCQPAPLR